MKLLKNNIFFVAMALMPVSNAIAFTIGDTDVGNGGDAVVCRDKNDKIKSAELLDYYEGRVMRRIQVNLGHSRLPVDDKVDIALDRLRRLSPKRAQIYFEFTQSFEKNTKFLPNITLIDVNDSAHLVYPRGCQVEQVAIYNAPTFPGDKPYTVNKDIWDAFSNTDKAGLILHEAIFKEALKSKQKNSKRTRYFNSLVSSTTLKTYGIRDFYRLISKYIHFKYFEYQGVMLLTYSFDGVNFYGDTDLVQSSNIAECPACIIKVGQIELTNEQLKGNKIEFYESGNVKILEFNGTHLASMNIEGQFLDVSLIDNSNFCHLKFYESGEPKEFCLYSKSPVFQFKRNGQIYYRVLQKNNKVMINQSGRILRGVFRVGKKKFIEPIKWRGRWLKIPVDSAKYWGTPYVGDDGISITVLGVHHQKFDIKAIFGFKEFQVEVEGFQTNKGGELIGTEQSKSLRFPILWGQIKKSVTSKKFGFDALGFIRELTPSDGKSHSFSFKNSVVPSRVSLQCGESISVWRNQQYRSGCHLKNSARINLLGRQINVSRKGALSFWADGSISFLNGHNEIYRLNLSGMSLEGVPYSFHEDGKVSLARVVTNLPIPMLQGEITLDLEPYPITTNTRWDRSGVLREAKLASIVHLNIQGKKVEFRGREHRNLSKYSSTLFHPNKAIKRGYILSHTKLENVEGYAEDYQGWTCFNDQGFVVDLCNP